jgi:hypothetical protein
MKNNFNNLSPYLAKKKIRVREDSNSRPTPLFNNNALGGCRSIQAELLTHRIQKTPQTFKCF